MADRPILFSAPMVRALLDGRKTQTRRMLYTVRDINENGDLPPSRYFKEYLPPNLGLNQVATLGTAHLIQPGDRLWVKETWRAGESWDDKKPTLIPEHVPIDYVATPREGGPAGKTRVSLFMRRWMSRLTLTVTDVRIERLQAISEADAEAEGVERHPDYPRLWRRGPLAGDQNKVDCTGFAKLAYRSIWEEINGAESWKANPWVVAITSDVAQRNIDA